MPRTIDRRRPIVRRRLPQELNHPRIDDGMLASAHLVAAAGDELAFDLWNQPPRPERRRA
jgi:hypothetical protein